MDTTCLYTTVRNVGDTDKTFGFLGEHGKRLAVGEVKTFRGNLLSKLGATTSARRFKALERSLEAGHLSIVSTPAVHLQDLTTGYAKVLSLTGGTLGAADPCWTSSSVSA